MDAEVVPVGPADADDLVALARAFHADEGRPLDAAAEAALAQIARGEPLARAWVARVAGCAVGYLSITLGYSVEYGGRDGFIDDLYLVPDARGRELAGDCWTWPSPRQRALEFARCIWRWRQRTTAPRACIVQSDSKKQTAGLCDGVSSKDGYHSVRRVVRRFSSLSSARVASTSSCETTGRSSSAAWVFPTRCVPIRPRFGSLRSARATGLTCDVIPEVPFMPLRSPGRD
jgi:hypothetical protein